MKLSKRARKAVEASVEHWENDICAELRDNPDEWYFKDHGDYCPLCRIYGEPRAQHPCRSCPYKKFYGYRCDRYDETDEEFTPIGHWAKWDEDNCIATAEAMRDALQKILDESEAKS